MARGAAEQMVYAMLDSMDALPQQHGAPRTVGAGFVQEYSQARGQNLLRCGFAHLVQSSTLRNAHRQFGLLLTLEQHRGFWAHGL